MADASAKSRPGGEQLESWKEIATYLRREVRTVQRWEKEEGLPVHRHPHKQRDTVYAYRLEIDAWRLNRQIVLETENPPPKPRRRWLILAGPAGLIVAGAVWFGLNTNPDDRASGG